MITLSTGREIDANEDFVGINEALEVSEGFDSRLYITKEDMRSETPWTLEERIELATRMIALWCRFVEAGVEV